MSKEEQLYIIGNPNMNWGILNLRNIFDDGFRRYYNPNNLDFCNPNEEIWYV